MTTVRGGEDDGDIEINPVTMLLLDPQDPKPKPEATSTTTTIDDQQQQTYSIASIESTVVIRQLPSQGLSFQLWPAANSLVALLDRHRSNPDASPFSASISGKRRILELGSGTGVVGIVASAVLGADVILTDLPHVLPNLRFNAEANSGVLVAHGGTVDVAALGWGKKEDMEAIGRDFDLILGSDVVYHDHLYEPLLETLKFLLLGKHCEPEAEEEEKAFLMAHLRRWKKENAFFKKAKRFFELTIIHEDGPSIESRTGVVVYRIARKKNAACFNTKKINNNL